MTRPTTDDDLDLMLAYDGEIEDGALDVGDQSAAAKLQGLAEVSELVRGHVELETDEADDRLSGLWARIEQRISTNGQSGVAQPAVPVREQPRTGLFARLVEWFEEHRGHFVTGAVSAAAVALIMVVVSPGEQPRTTTVVVPPSPDRAVQTGNDAAEATPPEIESLEVFQGTGTIVTLPNDDGSSTSVIWLAPEDAEETMEDPI